MNIEVKQYRITTANYEHIIEADRAEYMPNTGQTLFYINNEILHIVPVDAFVSRIALNK